VFHSFASPLFHIRLLFQKACEHIRLLRRTNTRAQLTVLQTVVTRTRILDSTSKHTIWKVVFSERGGELDYLSLPKLTWDAHRMIQRIPVQRTSIATTQTGFFHARFTKARCQLVCKQQDKYVPAVFNDFIFEYVMRMPCYLPSKITTFDSWREKVREVPKISGRSIW
jgi:hypothetical protein